jgi:hypothetical protein
MQLAGTVRRRLLLAVFSGAMALLGACGGGGDSSSGSDDPTSQYSASERSAATGRIAEKFEELASAGGATDAAWNALRDWVLTQPEFVAAGVGDQLLWAQFSDGRYFMYTDNWRTPAEQEITQRPSGPATTLDETTATRMLLQSAVGEVPGSADAVILGMKGAGEFDTNAPMLARMGKALTERGWKVAPDRLLTIESLKNRGKMGFLFVTTHSGIFGPTGQKEFAFMLETQVSAFNEGENKADLSDGSLIYHRDRTSWQRFGLGAQPRYAATAKFVSKYMKFAPDSLLILLSCHSGSAQGAGFRDALTKAGAGTIIGWDGNSSPNAYPTVDLLMDRLTGQNQVQRVTPANRPFNLDKVWADLDKKGLLTNPPPPPEPGEPAYTEAYVKRFGSGSAVLNPIIHALQATGDKLTIHGEFGSEPGSVSVGGVPVTPVWAADGKKIEALLGNATHGEVVVTARGRRSNVRVLADWRGSVTYAQESQEVTGCDEAWFHNTVVIGLHLRADAHGMREEIDGPVKNNPYPIVPAPDTRATWTAGGSCPDHTSWSGSGAFTFRTDLDPSDPSGELPTGNRLTARIDTVEGRFQLGGVFGHEERKTVVSLGTTRQQALTFDTELAGFVNRGPDFTKLLPYGTFLPFGTQLNVGASQHQQAHDVLPHRLTVRWSALSASPAYDDGIGR